jgi:hypothetical protein
MALAGGRKRERRAPLPHVGAGQDVGKLRQSAHRHGSRNSGVFSLALVD